MKYNVKFKFIVLLTLCLILNIGIRIFGNVSVLNYFVSILVSFTLGLYVGDTFVKIR